MLRFSKILIYWFEAINGYSGKYLFLSLHSTGLLIFLVLRMGPYDDIFSILDVLVNTIPSTHAISSKMQMWLHRNYLDHTGASAFSTWGTTLTTPRVPLEKARIAPTLHQFTNIMSNVNPGIFSQWFAFCQRALGCHHGRSPRGWSSDTWNLSPSSMEAK